MRFDTPRSCVGAASAGAAALARLVAVIFCLGLLSVFPAAPDAGVAPLHAAAQGPGAGEAAGVDLEDGAEAHAEGVLPTIDRLFNFAILAGVLVYFLRTPIRSYLATRGGQIRHDLVTAAETRATASAQLAAIQDQLKMLPGELEALRIRGAEDVKLERERIAQAASNERQRLLDLTRREIDMRLRVAHREMVEQTATLAVGVAQTRLERTMTTDDQLRLVDRYAGQLGEAR
jgi:F-type H+-transporting ATPase subunit b